MVGLLSNLLDEFNLFDLDRFTGVLFNTFRASTEWIFYHFLHDASWQVLRNFHQFFKPQVSDEERNTEMACSIQRPVEIQTLKGDSRRC